MLSHIATSYVVGRAVFHVQNRQVRAHKTHLVARSEYFRSMFRKGAMRESETCEVFVKEHEEATLRQMLEYIYTNRVKDMPGLSADEVIKLLALANGTAQKNVDTISSVMCFVRLFFSFVLIFSSPELNRTVHTHTESRAR